MDIATFLPDEIEADEPDSVDFGDWVLSIRVPRPGTRLRPRWRLSELDGVRGRTPYAVGQLKNDLVDVPSTSSDDRSKSVFSGLPQRRWTAERKHFRDIEANDALPIADVASVTFRLDTPPGRGPNLTTWKTAMS